MRVFTCLVSLLATAQCVAVPASHVIHEKRDVTSSRWLKRDRLPAKSILPMRIGLKQRNLDQAYDMLMDVSHPDSQNYGKHWTAEQVIEKFSPKQETIDSVRQWLLDSGISNQRITHSDNRGWLAFDITTEEAETLLHTEFYSYEHAGTGQKDVACDKYHVPAHIQEHLDYITPGIKLLSATKPHRRSQGLEDGIGKRLINRPPKLSQLPGIKLATAPNITTCDKYITPSCIRELYQIPSVPEYPSGFPNLNNSMGIFEAGDFYAQKDLDLFFTHFAPQITNGTHPIPAFIDGANAPVSVKNAGTESELDLQLAYPIVWPQTVMLYQTDDLWYTEYYSTPAAFNTFLDGIDGSYCNYSAFGETGNDPLDPEYPDPFPFGWKGQLQCGVYEPTNVISVSYGGAEADLPAYYQQRQCNEFMKLGLRGISIFFASGDDGVQNSQLDTFSKPCLGPNATVFSPAWPNTCPYITNVGATKLYPGQTTSDLESAVVDEAGHPWRYAFSSGGGFSNIYGPPDYQKEAVERYFRDNDPGYEFYGDDNQEGFGNGRYNRSGRGYPDVSANGDNIVIYSKGNSSLSGGTSASTPIFAAIINRINEQRLNAGKSTVGFVNPVLYNHPEVLNDVVNGSNPGCGTKGFGVGRGWDPVTGLGTPNYPKMMELFISLP